MTPHFLKYFTQLSRGLEFVLERLGRLVARQPFPFIIIPVLITVAVLYGVVLRNDRMTYNPKLIYPPEDSQGLKDEAAFYATWPRSGEPNFVPFRTYDYILTSSAIVSRVDGGNVLNVDSLNHVSAFNDEVTSMVVDDQNTTFEKVCMRWKRGCSFENEHLRTFAFLLKHNYSDDLTYPLMDSLGTRVYIGRSVGGVELVEPEVHSDDRSRPSKSLVIQSAKALYLIYYLNDSAVLNDAKLRWEGEFAKRCENFSDEEYNLRYMTSTSVRAGCLLAAEAITSKIIYTIICLGCFVSLVGLKVKLTTGPPWVHVNYWKSKVTLCLFGLVTPGLAAGTSMGLVLLCGYSFDPIASIMPFLVLSIGVDDMFIMLGAWRRSNPKASVASRLGFTMRDCAVSITFTSLTSALSFLVGCSSTIMLVRIFCTYTTVGIVVNYLYQVTFFTGCMAIAGRVEQRKSFRRLWADPDPPVDSRPPETVTTANGDAIDGAIRNQAAPGPVVRIDSHVDKPNLFERVYGENLLSSIGEASVVVLFFLYILLSGTGLARLKVGVIGAVTIGGAVAAVAHPVQVGFDPSEMFTDDFMATKYYLDLQKFFWDKGWQIEILVQNPGNLTNRENRLSQRRMQYDFDHSPCSIPMGDEQFWLGFYERQQMDTAEMDKMRSWSEDVYDWSKLNYVAYHFSQDLAWRPPTPEEEAECSFCQHMIKAYRFRVALTDYSSTVQQARCMTIMRDIAAQYSQYNVVVFTSETYWTDLYNSFVPMTLRNIFGATACVVVVALIFLQDLMCLIAVIVTILSIDFGVLGLMGWWSVKLDIVSMMTILMSIGLSVDYSAHITYAFKHSTAHEPKAQVLAALREVGLPVLQGASSTFLGIMPLSTTGTYMGTSFFKVVCLIIAIGMLHGCVFLPIIFKRSKEVASYCKRHVQRVRKVNQSGGECAKQQNSK